MKKSELSVGHLSNNPLSDQSVATSKSYVWLKCLAATSVIVLITLGFGYNTYAENPTTEQQLLSTEKGEMHRIENYPQWHLPKEAKMRLGKGVE